MSEQAGLKGGGETLNYATPLLERFPPLLKNRNFLLLWLGYVISALGDRIHFLVMLKLLEGMKGGRAGAQETAQLNIMMLLPFLALGPLSGVIADRLPRRLVMITADFARVAIVVAARTIFLEVPANSPLHQAVPWMPAISYVVLMLLISELLVGIFSAFFSPARTALLPNLVHPDQLLRANSMTNAAGTVASLIGFLAGAALIRWDLTAAMYVDAGAFLGSAICLLLMRLPRVSAGAAQEAGKGKTGKGKKGIFSDFVEGIRYLLKHKHATQIIFLMFLFWCAGAVILSGLTGIVTHKFGKDVDWFGNFLGVVGIGMMAGAACLSLARRGLPKEVGIAWATVFVGVFLLLFSIPAHWGLALFFLTVCGFFGAVLLVTLDTLLQRIVPDRVRGRVMAARDMLANVGLVGMAVPLAIDPNIDAAILVILRVLAVVVMAVGLGLVIFYYRRQPLPLAAAILLRFTRGFLGVWHRMERKGACTIPGKGPVVVVANHISAMDPVILQASSPRRIIHFMMAKEYYEKRPWHWLCKAFGTIPVNRSGTDIAAVRAALRVLKEGHVIGLFPEGKISLTGEMQEAQHGVAAIVLMAGATVVPAHLNKGMPYQGMVKDFTKRGHVHVRYGRPMRFDEFKGKDRDKAVLEAVTGKIMAAIGRLGG